MKINLSSSILFNSFLLEYIMYTKFLDNGKPLPSSMLLIDIMFILIPAVFYHYRFNQLFSFVSTCIILAFAYNIVMVSYIICSKLAIASLVNILYLHDDRLTEERYIDYASVRLLMLYLFNNTTYYLHEIIGEYLFRRKLLFIINGY